MKNVRGMFPVMLLAATALGVSAQAQKTTILKQGADRPQTVIEVERGYVIVNDDTVVRPGQTGYRKIVIDRESDAPGFGMRPFGGGSMGGNTAQKARLGVLTDPQQSKGGAYIREVQPASPAQAAGLRAGDKIVAVDGATIADAQELIETISAHAPEDTVKITYERSGKRLNTTAYLEGAALEGGGMSGGMFGMPPGGDFSEELGKLFGGGGGGLFGSKDAEAPKLGISVEERADGVGVQVLDVTAGSLAEKAGLRTGDVITHLGDVKIDAPTTLQQTVRRQQGKDLTLKYQRNGKSMSTKLMIPKSLRKMDM
ncbi:MAG: PDZ domain-containing protein [Sphingobacteriales bacterium]|nr:MAG: PDZ domain-containing protein [Sphingobacteriales bacterium]